MPRNGVVVIRTTSERGKTQTGVKVPKSNLSVTRMASALENKNQVGLETAIL